MRMEFLLEGKFPHKKSQHHMGRGSRKKQKKKEERGIVMTSWIRTVGMKKTEKRM